MKLRFYFIFTRELFKRFYPLIIIATLAGLIFFGFILKDVIKISKKTENIGIVGYFNLSSIPPEISNLITSGLTQVTDNQKIIPSLAKNWSTPDGGLTWIFEIDTSKTWQDGKSLEASDIILDLREVGVTYKDTKTVIFNLKDKYSAFPSILTKPIFRKKMTGTGEWKIIRANYQRETLKTLKIKNKKGDSKIFKFFATDNTAITALKLGTIDSIWGLQSIEGFKPGKNIKVSEEVNKNKVVIVFFNTRKNLFSNKETRRAINYSINKDEISQNKAYTTISPLSEDYNPFAKKYEYSIDQAKEIIKEQKNVEGKNVNLATHYNLLTKAEIIKKQLKLINLNVNITLSAAIPKDFDIYLSTFDIPIDPDQYPLWHSTQEATNISGYTNPRIDKLLEDGRLIIDEQERKKIYFDFQRYLAEDSPAIPLYHPVGYKIERI